MQRVRRLSKKQAVELATYGSSDLCHNVCGGDTYWTCYVDWVSTRRLAKLAEEVQQQSAILSALRQTFVEKVDVVNVYRCWYASKAHVAESLASPFSVGGQILN